MAFFMLSFICLMIVYVSIVIPGSLSSNFPLHDCLTDEMDILFVGTPITDYKYFTNGGTIEDFTVDDQKQVMIVFLNRISVSNDTQTTPRVMYATVRDTFSDDNPNVDVSSWYFQGLNGTVGEDSFKTEFGIDCDSGNSTPYLTLNSILEKKIKFIRRLFSEMSGVRKNVTHIAVIFLDGYDLSYADSRNIPNIVQQHQTDIKIFTIVFRNKHDNEIIHLNDVILLTSTDIRVDSCYGAENALVIMAICQLCQEDWFPFVHNNGTESLSCYKVVSLGTDKMNEEVDITECGDRKGMVATLETQEELDYVRTKLYRYIREDAETRDQDYLSQLSVRVSIGLRRNLTSIAKQFQWSLQEHAPYRPLVVNKWMPDKPSGGRDNACGVWKFVWDDHKNGTNYSRDINIIDDGWVDVECKNISNEFVFCEKALPRRLDGQNLMRINPASNESLTNALSKGYLMKLGDNIASFSTQVGSTHFITFINEFERKLFPLFDCGEDTCSPRYISYALVCDYVEHCSNKRDERVCIYATGLGQHTKQDLEYECEDFCCDDYSCLPLEYVRDGEIDCLLYFEEIFDENPLLDIENITNKNCAFICNKDQCISYSQLNDNHTDCTGPEGPLDETIGKLKTVNTCNTPVRDGLWAPRCVFIKDMYGGVIGCRDVSHLRNCTDFECPEGYFKCPQSYCIPKHYVLDGKVDCPTGEEEQNDNIVSCTGNFACWNSKICVHPDLVCDGHAECPHQDDELDCKVPCREGFICVTWGVMVSGHNKSSPLVNLDFIDNRTRYMDLSGVDLSNLKFLDNSSRLGNVVDVKLADCKINDLQYLLLFLTPLIQTMDISYNLIKIFNYSASQFPALRNIRHLNLSYNKELDDVKDLELIYLEILDLSHTGLSYLDNSFFHRLPEIKHLNLSCTSISVLFKHLFPRNLNLSSLDLRGLNIDNFYKDLFNGLTIGQHLYTDYFQTCCPYIRGVNIPFYTCHAPEDAISSCFDLVRDDVQRVLLWMVICLVVLVNATVIVYRVIWDRTVLRTGYGLFVTNLGISDFIMGVYLFIIVGADYYYRGVYVSYDKNWREGNVCRLAGFLATLSCETSTYFIFLITLDRFLLMKFPFNQKQFLNKIKMIGFTLSWIIGFLLALIPIVFKFEINSSNAMCLGLPLTTQRLTGWQYSFGVFIVHNLFMFLLIAYGQRAIFTAMIGNRIDSSTPSRRVEDILVAKQLFLVAMFNFLCWIPVGIIGILSLVGHEISDVIYVWTAIIILPFNSAANPVMYTIPAILDAWHMFKYGDTRSHSST